MEQELIIRNTVVVRQGGTNGLHQFVLKQSTQLNFIMETEDDVSMSQAEEIRVFNVYGK